MLVLTLTTEIPLTEPSVDYGFISTIEIEAREFDAASREPVGRARIRLINVADAINRGIPIHDVLDADSEEMFQLFEVFFDEDEYLKEPYGNGVGSNVIYFESVELSPKWTGRQIEEAIILRLVDTWGEGCAIAVLPVESKDAISRWSKIGFEPIAEGMSSYVYLDLSKKHPDVFPDDAEGNAFHVGSEGD